LGRDNKNHVFLESGPRGGDFAFDFAVTNVFDDMLVRSIPFYSEQQSMVMSIAKKFCVPNTDVYDLGFSTGTTLINLCHEIGGAGRYIGYDNSQFMLERAKLNVDKANLMDKIDLRLGDLNGDLGQLRLKNASVVTMLWTLQFIRPLQREKLVRWIYNGLIENGVLIVTEKVLTNNTDMNRFFIDFYYDFKRKKGYMEEEIRRKREALENVLIPYRTDENFEMFHRNNFTVAEPFFRWFNFIGLMAIKKEKVKK